MQGRAGPVTSAEDAESHTLLFVRYCTSHPVHEPIGLLQGYRSKGLLGERARPEPTLLRWDAARAAPQQLRGPGSVLLGIPVAAHLAAQTPRIPSRRFGQICNEAADKGAREAGVCAALGCTEGHSEGVGTGAGLQADRAPGTRLQGGASSRPRIDSGWLSQHGEARAVTLLGSASISKWPRDQARRPFSWQSQ